MAKVTASNYSSPAFTWGTTLADLFNATDLENLGQALDAHDHSAGKGLAVARLAGAAAVGTTIVNGAGTLTLPTTTDTLVGRATTDTLTNKTLTAPVIATIANTGTLTLPTSTDTLVGKATTDTLTNKTLTAPIISTIVNTGVLSLPTSTDTLVGKATTDTLTNKTLTAPAISAPAFSGTPTGSLTNLALTTPTLTTPTITGASTQSGLATANGGLTVAGSRQQLAKGATVASANNLTLGMDGNVFQISGTTTINLISSTGWQEGSHFSLYLAGALTMKHGFTFSGAFQTLNLAGSVDWAATANSTITFMLVNSVWLEQSRTVR